MQVLRTQHLRDILRAAEQNGDKTIPLYAVTMEIIHEVPREYLEWLSERANQRS